MRDRGRDRVCVRQNVGNEERDRGWENSGSVFVLVSEAIAGESRTQEIGQ